MRAFGFRPSLGRRVGPLAPTELSPPLASLPTRQSWASSGAVGGVVGGKGPKKAKAAKAEKRVEARGPLVGREPVIAPSRQNAEDRLPECPPLAAQRETADGRTYVMFQSAPSKTGESPAVLHQRFCRPPPLHVGTGEVARPAPPSLRSDIGERALADGERVLEAIWQPRSARDSLNLDRLRKDFRRSTSHYVWLGVDSKDLDCRNYDGAPGSRPYLLGANARAGPRAPFGRGYWFGQQIGRGSFGSVHEACKDEDCKYVLKIAMFADDFGRESARREISIMKQLEPTKLGPKLLNYRFCDDKALLLMERFDMSAEELGRRQFSHFFGEDAAQSNAEALLFTETQIIKIFTLALRLSQAGVVHGDLKLDNIMYRLREDDFIVIDFGFSGTYRTVDGKYWEAFWGFTHVMGCNSCPEGVDECARKPISKSLVPYANIWQLMVDLGGSYPIVLIALEAPGTRKVVELRLLEGLGPAYQQILNRKALAKIETVCRDPGGAAAANRAVSSALRDQLLRHIQPYWM
jgi:Protein kinase domain